MSFLKRFKTIKNSNIIMAKPYKIPKTFKRTVSPRELRKFQQSGWNEVRRYQNNIEIKREIKKHEKIEIKLRMLFKDLNFEDHTPDVDDFNYTEFGNQIDACGGVGKNFMIIDCTSKYDPGSKSIEDKIKDNVQKRLPIINKIKEKYGDKYSKFIFVICTEDILISEDDRNKAKNQDIKLVDIGFFDKCIKYRDILGETLKYQILKRLEGEKAIITDDGDSSIPYECPCFRIETDGKILYNFIINPKTLLKISYVYRIERENERGYQRELKFDKLTDINEFILSGEKFLNNIIISFDKTIKDEDLFYPINNLSIRLSSNVKLGVIKIPKIYCISEIVDGQHRVYGYLDTSEDKRNDTELNQKRRDDRVVVIGFTDPGEDKRARTYLDINSTQTKINTNELWSLMGNVKSTILEGYISNIVKELNEEGVFKNQIDIPGKLKVGKRPISLANFCKGLKDRKLVQKIEDNDSLDWNLFDGNRITSDYPVQIDKNSKPIKYLNEYFNAVSESYKSDWNSEDGFLRSNNGVNVMLRILVGILKFYKHKEITNFNKKGIKKFLSTSLRNYIKRRKPKKLKKITSNEGTRKDVAMEIIKEIGKKRAKICVEFQQYCSRHKREI